MLTDTKVKNAKPENGKSKKFADGRGMYLLAHVNGSKYWRFRYTIDGRENQIALGVYPDISLEQARERREAARKLVAKGVDPVDKKRSIKMATGNVEDDCFETVAMEWWQRQKNNWSKSHAVTTLQRLNYNLMPYLAIRPITTITTPELLGVLRKVEARGAHETSRRALQIVTQIFRYAIVTGRIESNPATDLRGALTPPRKSHFAALTKPDDVAQLMRAIHGYTGDPVTCAALKFLPLVFVRQNELRHAQWQEIDFENALWEIPAVKMKTDHPHVVPLSKQSLQILREIHDRTGSCDLVFPSPRDKKRAMSNNAILAALRRMGYTKDEMTGHGFRAMARTILDEVLNVRVEYIEHQLAHTVRDPLGRAYNRTKHLDERREMMQLWANYLDDISKTDKKAM